MFTKVTEHKEKCLSVQYMPGLVFDIGLDYKTAKIEIGEGEKRNF